MTSVNAPLFCVTADIDWASEYAINDFLTLIGRFSIRPTLFATHKSEVLDKFVGDGAVELGVHPNFLPGSSHGNDLDSVIGHICALFPRATTFRSHSFVDSSPLTERMVRRGFRYDSNLCLYMQPNLVPLWHQSGIMRFPVFWADDVHWTRTGGDWRFDSCAQSFFSPGLKIVDVHPFTMAANIPSGEYYLSIKAHTKTLNAGTIGQVRFAGEGARTFLINFLEAAASRGEKFYTLAELYQMFSAEMNGQ